jgi:hypothetical protein
VDVGKKNLKIDGIIPSETIHRKTSYRNHLPEGLFSKPGDPKKKYPLKMVMCHGGFPKHFEFPSKHRSELTLQLPGGWKAAVDPHQIALSEVLLFHLHEVRRG